MEVGKDELGLDSPAWLSLESPLKLVWRLSGGRGGPRFRRALVIGHGEGEAGVVLLQNIIKEREA